MSGVRVNVAEQIDPQCGVVELGEYRAGPCLRLVRFHVPACTCAVGARHGDRRDGPGGGGIPSPGPDVEPSGADRDGEGDVLGRESVRDEGARERVT